MVGDRNKTALQSLGRTTYAGQSVAEVVDDLAALGLDPRVVYVSGSVTLADEGMRPARPAETGFVIATILAAIIALLFLSTHAVPGSPASGYVPQFSLPPLSAPR